MSVVPVTAGNVYKCTDADGQVSLQDEPCPKAQRSSVIMQIVDEGNAQPVPLSQPPAPEAFAGIALHPGYRIDQEQLETTVWQKALDVARRHIVIQDKIGSFTLVRVFVQYPERETILQVASARVKRLEDDSGGLYRQVTNGEFFIVEHGANRRRRNGQDPFSLGSFHHTRPELWVDVPKLGTVSALGDVLLPGYPEDDGGVLAVNIMVETKHAATFPTLIVGPAAVGGPYGRKYKINDGSVRIPKLTPGPYRILLDKSDPFKNHWDIEIKSQRTTTVTLLAKSQTLVEKAAEAMAE